MTQWLRQYGLTPKHAIIMAVLASVLAAVWGPQLMSSRDEAPVVARKTRAASRRAPAATGTAVSDRRASARSATTEKKATEETAKPRDLPQFTASEAGAFDPFAAPAWSPATQSLAEGSLEGGASTNSTARFDAIRSQGVAMILVSPDGKAAQVGNRTVRVGDQIDGFEVIDITPDGVVFMPASAKSAEGVDGA